MNKQDTWNAFKAPTDQRCENCKWFPIEPHDKYCLHPDVDFDNDMFCESINLSKSTWWEWDGITK